MWLLSLFGGISESKAGKTKRELYYGGVLSEEERVAGAYFCCLTSISAAEGGDRVQFVQNVQLTAVE